jgi:lysophospholipase L1-like esterase
LIDDLQTNNTVDLVGSQEHGDMTDSYNEGHAGYRIGEIAAVTNASLAYNPDIVLLHVGTNDMVQNFFVATAPERLGGLIDQILAIVPYTTLLVAQIIPTWDVTFQDRYDLYNSQIPEVVQLRADKGAHIMTVDMSTLLDTQTDYADPVHPNDQGYAKMANAWYQALEVANGNGWLQNATNGNITVTQNTLATVDLPAQLTPGAKAASTTIPTSVAAATTTGAAKTSGAASASASHTSGARRQAAVPMGSLFGVPGQLWELWGPAMRQQW